MITKNATDFLKFWCDARGENLVPAHTDIRLENLESLSARAIYSIRDDQGRFIMTYVGTNLVEAFGADITGMDQLSFSRPEELEVSKLTLALMGDHPCGIMGAITLRGEETTPREYECIYLPVEHEGRNSHILELVTPLDIDYRLEDAPGSMQALRYGRRTFIDIGTGTPPLEGPVAGEATCTLKDLLPD